MGDGDLCEELVADCRMRMATDLFAHTWDAVVLAALAEGALRRRSLRARIGGISDKALTEAVHRLVGNGLVERRFFPRRRPGSITRSPISAAASPTARCGRWAPGSPSMATNCSRRRSGSARRSTANGPGRSRTPPTEPPGVVGVGDDLNRRFNALFGDVGQDSTGSPSP